MKQVSFIHFADLHMDAAFTTLEDISKAHIRRKEIENCFRHIVEEVRTRNINLLLISGDFFEDSKVKGSTILTIKNLFSEIYNTEIIIYPGNHDPIRERSYYKQTDWGRNVHILENSQQVLYLEKYNTCIYNIGTRGNVKEDYEILRKNKLSREKFNLLIFHGTIDMPFEEVNYNPISSKELLSTGMDYVASGHIHRYYRTQNDQTLLINPGSPEPLGFDEEGIHGYVQGWITLSDENEKSIDAMFIPSATRQYHNVEVNISDCIDDDEVIKRIQADERIKFNARDFYSLTLNGFITKEYIINIKYISDILAKNCFYIRIKNQTSVQFNFQEYLEDPGIKGEFVRRIMDMLETETKEEKRETLFMAIQYGLQAMENGRVD